MTTPIDGGYHLIFYVTKVNEKVAGIARQIQLELTSKLGTTINIVIKDIFESSNLTEAVNYGVFTIPSIVRIEPRPLRLVIFDIKSVDQNQVTKLVKNLSTLR